MSRKPNRKRERIDAIEGPVQPETVLYRMLQLVAQEIAKAMAQASPSIDERERRPHDPS